MPSTANAMQETKKTNLGMEKAMDEGGSESTRNCTGLGTLFTLQRVTSVS